MPNSLQIALQNQTNSGQVYAYITGLAIQNNSARVLVAANGKDLYYPTSPSTIGSPLAQDCAIPLGSPGNTVTVTIPQIAGGRVWFSVDSKLTFLLNPGPALVEPSVLNPSDPNANVNFGFCEFTLNNDQLFANISYVDFVPRVPIALTLQTSSGGVQHVSGMPANGLDTVCNDLKAQATKDGRPWDKLVVTNNGQNLRALSPTHSDAVGASFNGYYEPYVDSVWAKYRQGVDAMQINTQAAAGVVSGSVNDSNQLVVAGESFNKPSTGDIFSCNTGPFVTGSSATRNAIIPRLAAAFVRSTLLATETLPSDPSFFYTTDPTDHYARIVHAVNLDGKGYAFAYDDVSPDGGADQSGKVNAGDPTLWTIAVGGNNAYAGDQLPPSGANVQVSKPQEEESQQPIQQGQPPAIPPRPWQQTASSPKRRLSGFKKSGSDQLKVWAQRIFSK